MGKTGFLTHRELDVAQGGDQEVVGLEISVDNPEGVEILHREHGLRKIESGTEQR